MRRTLSFAILAVFATAPHAQAQAGDFTGAYAGVNAGYGFEHGRNAKKPSPGVGPAQNTTASDAEDLPPSAAIAAKSLQQAQSAARR